MKRNFGLDVLRSFSILLVLFSHSPLKIHRIDVGGTGVEFFFVLSGFLIGGVLFNLLEKQLGFTKTLYQFWVSRWFRILPLYYLVLICKFVFLDSSIGFNILYYIFFLQNQFYGIQYLEVSWSLVIEEWFYIFTPLLLFFIHRNHKLRTFLPQILVSIMFMVLLIRGLYVLLLDVPRGGVNGNILFRYDSLLMGVLLSYFQKYQASFFKSLSSFKVVLLGFLMFAFFQGYYYFQAVSMEAIQYDFTLRVFGFSFLPLSIALMLPWISSFESMTIKGGISKGIYWFFTYTSLWTYALYLSHTFTFSLVGLLIHEDNLFLWIITAFSLTYLTSFLLYHYFEKPFLKWRQNWV